jgi:hypothetical protein
MSEQQVEQVGTLTEEALAPAPDAAPDGPRVGIIMGSASDMETMQKAGAVLREAEIPYEIEVMSAHRDPERVAEYCRSARGCGSSSRAPGCPPPCRASPRLTRTCRSSASRCPAA